MSHYEMPLLNKRVAARGTPTERLQAARLADRSRRVGVQRRQGPSLYLWHFIM